MVIPSRPGWLSRAAFLLLGDGLACCREVIQVSLDPTMADWDPSQESSPDSATLTADELAPTWHVIVLNDPVNLMSYVVMVFRKVFGFNADRARKHMLEVHEQGRSRLWTGEREQAETYVHALQGWQLNAKLEKDAAS